MKGAVILFVSMIFLCSFVSASTNMTENIIETTGNLTLGQKITFAFGEIIDNIIDGWVRVTGGLNVTGNFSVDASTFYVDSENQRVGIGTSTPQDLFNVVGDGNVTGTLYVLGVNISDNNISMGNYVVDYVAIQNTSLVNYIGVVNTSVNNWITDNNNSVNNYIADNNNTIVNWVTSTFATISNLNLKVSWTDLWNQVYNKTEVDAINTSTTNYINDNNASVVNHINLNNDSIKNYADSTFVNVNGDNMTGFLNTTAGINLNNNATIGRSGIGTNMYIDESGNLEISLS